MNSIFNSIPSCKSELDLFATYPTNVQILENEIIEIQTTNNNNEIGDSFKIPIIGTSSYINLSETRLSFKINLFKYKNEGGKLVRERPIESSDKVGVINNLAHSIFNKIEVSFGEGIENKPFEINDNYAYKAYLINLLNYGIDSKESWMECGLYAQDVPGEFENFNLQEVKQEGQGILSKTVNNGFIKRRQYFIDLKGIVDVIIPLHCDIFYSDRLLKDNININLSFTKNPDNFLIKGIDADKFKLTISDVTLLVTKCKINNEVQKAILNTLQTSNLKYPLRPLKINEMIIDDGLKKYKSTFQNNVIIPNIIIFALVEDSAFNGNHTLNPFNFGTNKLTSIKLTLNSMTYSINIDYESNHYIQAYEKLMSGLNLFGIRGNHINRNDFKKGNAIYFYDLRPIKSCHGEHNFLKSGVLNLSLEFSESTTKKLKLISISEYENQLQINKDSKVSYDFNI